MHPIITSLLKPLAQQSLIPPDVWLTSLELVAVPIIGTTGASSAPRATYKARSQGTYYTFSGSIHEENQESLGGMPMAYKLTFWQPREQGASKWHFGERQGRYSFSLLSLEQFLAASGDQNPLHQGDTPVVPGLMIASWALERLDGHRGHGSEAGYPERIYFKFTQPLMVGQPFDWLSTETGYCIASGSTLYTQIQIENLGESHDEHN